LCPATIPVLLTLSPVFRARPRAVVSSAAKPPHWIPELVTGAQVMMQAGSRGEDERQSMAPVITIDPRPARTARPRRISDIAPPDPRERLSPGPSRHWLAADTLALVLIAVIVLTVLSHHLFNSTGQPVGDAAVKMLVERIITCESGGDANARNKRSTATGAGQFIDDTWLEAVRRHRHDLLQGRSDREILELRRDPELSREIATRLVEQYAALLNKRGLPVTPGSLYLTYFAGPAGAVALLSSAEDADAATLMAAADTTGRTSREKLVTANPFLKTLSAGDLRKWADGKMRGT
jgi:hypothetical protein